MKKFILLTLFLGFSMAEAASRDVYLRASSDQSLQHGILFYSKNVKPRATLLFVHGMQSHAEWMRASGVGDSLAEAGITVFAYDRRGSGKSSTTRGHADSAQILLNDLNDAVIIFRGELAKDQRISNPAEIEMHLMANCFGARIAVPYLIQQSMQKRYPFSTVTLIAPSTHMTKQADYSFGEKLDVLASPRLQYLATPLQDEWFTTSPKGLAWIRQDQLGLREVTAGFLRSANTLTKTMNREVYRMTFPLLVLTASRDVMVDSAGVKRDLYDPYRGPKRLVNIDSEHSLEFSASGKAPFLRATIDWILGSGRKVWH